MGLQNLEDSNANKEGNNITTTTTASSDLVQSG